MYACWKVFDDIRLVRPTIVACTPRFWTLIYNQFQQEVLLATTQAMQQWRKKCEEVEERRSNGTQAVPTETLANSDTSAEGQRASVEAAAFQTESADEESLRKGLQQQVLLSQETEQERLRSGLQRQVSVQSEVERSLLEESPVEPDATQIKEVVMKRFAGILGNRVVVMVTGGAATSSAVLRFMRTCFNSMVSDGYGATEVGLATAQK